MSCKKIVTIPLSKFEMGAPVSKMWGRELVHLKLGRIHTGLPFISCERVKGRGGTRMGGDVKE